MAQQIAGSVTRDAAALRSADPAVRQQAARRIWERFEPRLLELVRRRLNPRLRVRADEEDIVQSLFQSFFAAPQDEHGSLPEDRDGLWRLLVWLAMCKVANTAHRHQALRRDFRREDVPWKAAELCSANLASWMAEVEDRAALPPQDAVIFQDEFERLLGLLPEDLQQIFVWRLEGHTNAEIGNAINRTERTVELKMRIIRKTLERELGAQSGTHTG
jgi:RNA polymerase sigma factor (sigma-70 family)